MKADFCLLLQLCLVAPAPLLAWAPLGEGPAIVLPLVPATPGATLSALRESGGRLVGVGPVPGSVIVMGERPRLAAAALSWGALALAAPSQGCGVDVETRR